MPDNCYRVWKEGMGLGDLHRLLVGYEFNKRINNVTKFAM